MRFRAIFLRVIKELIRDKRTLALMLLAPLFVLTLMNVVFDINEETQVKIGVTSTVPSEIVQGLVSDQVVIETYDSQLTPQQVIRTDELDAFLTLDETTFKVTYENTVPGTSAKVQQLLQNVLLQQTLVEQAQLLTKSGLTTSSSLPNYQVESTYLYGSSDSTFFDNIFPMLIGFFIFFFVFLVSGIALLNERTAGTLERLLASPIKRSEIILGYLAGYGLFAILQTLFIILFSLFVLKLTIVGSFLLILITTILLALVALSMGLFISTFARSEFQMMQFIPLIVIPQIFFSGVIPLDTMAPWVKLVSYLFPLSYAGQALSDIMLKGLGLQAIWGQLVVLSGFILGFTLLNILGLKRYRKV
ncbi:MAG: ABC transporter permease [Enterococcus sp.]